MTILTDLSTAFISTNLNRSRSATTVLFSIALSTDVLSSSSFINSGYSNVTGTLSGFTTLKNTISSRSSLDASTELIILFTSLFTKSNVASTVMSYIQSNEISVVIVKSSFTEESSPLPASTKYPTELTSAAISSSIYNISSSQIISFTPPLPSIIISSKLVTNSSLILLSSVSVNTKHSISTSSSVILTTPPPDTPPKVQNPLGHIYAETGRRLSFKIPNNVFNDFEDGGTINLTLECVTSSGDLLSSNKWLDFNSTAQTLSGLPLKSDFITQKSKSLILKLFAYDKSKNFAVDTFTLLIIEPLSTLTFTISLTLAIEYKKFIGNKNLRQLLIQRISQFYGDTSSSLYIESIVQGSTIVTWSNTSLGISTCNKAEIDKIIQVVQVPTTKTPSTELLSYLLPEFPVLGISSSYKGACNTTVVIPTVTSSPVSQSSNRMSYIIPVVVSIIVLLAVIIILVAYWKRRRRNSFFPNRRTYEKGRPVLLPDEIELQNLPEKTRVFENLPKSYIGPYDDDEIDGKSASVNNSARISSSSSSCSSYSSLEYIPPSEPPPPYIPPPSYIPPFFHR